MTQRSSANDAKSTQDGRSLAINRRRLLQGAGVAVAGGVAGCSSSSNTTDTEGETDDNNAGAKTDGKMGERVPQPFVIMTHGGVAEASALETLAPVMQKSVADALNLDVSIENLGVTTALSNATDDKRNYDYWLLYNGAPPERLDPHGTTIRNSAPYAGAGGGGNNGNYASCEYTDYAYAQATATDPDERRELVYKAWSTFSNDKAYAPIIPRSNQSAARGDLVTIKRAGEFGLNRLNSYPYIYSTLNQGNQLVMKVAGSDLETANFGLLDSGPTIYLWSHYIYSSLVEYDENLELTNLLAKDYTIENDGKKFTVELRDATFHNGDPITAEDVKFTFKLLWDQEGVYSQADTPEYESIDVIDDKTVQFNMTNPYLPLERRIWPRWGIFPKKLWEEGGANDDLSSFSPDPIIGSGPFKVNDFQAGQHLDLSPHDGHPVHNPKHDLFMQAYDDQTTAVEALLAGELHIAEGLSSGSIGRVKDKLGDEAYIDIAQTFMPFYMAPSYPQPPMKFPEFRDAIGKSLDRQTANQLVYDGEVKPDLYAGIWQPNHPFRPPNDRLHKYTDKVGGDPEAAKHVLEDAGWSWDDDGRLRYPPDADLTPMWPKGDKPSSENGFDCLDADGNYAE